MAIIDRLKQGAEQLGRTAGEIVRSGVASYNASRHPPKPPPLHDDVDEPEPRIAKGRGDTGMPTGAAFDPLDAYGRITEEAASTQIHPGTWATSQWTLERLARLSVPAIVINHLIDELAEFCFPQLSPHVFGFRITPDDDEANQTPGQKRRAKEIEKVLMAGGGDYQDGGLEGFVRRIMRGSLIQDAAPFEVLFNGYGEPTGMFAYDPKTIRRRKPDAEYLARGQWGEDPGYVQWVNQRIRKEWDADQFKLGIRRPRSDMESFNYGWPELDEIAVVLGNFARAENYNAVNFTSGIHTSHLLAIVSGMDREAFQAYRRMFEANFSAANAKRRLPVVQLDPELKEDMKAVALGHPNREMEYTNWLYYHVKLICAAYGVDPASALNMVFGNEGQSSSMGSASPADRYLQSKAHGVRPKLRALAQWLTFIVKMIDPEQKLVFGGFDSITEEEKLKLDVMQMSNFLTVNEVRTRYDLAPIEGPAGDIIANPYVSQAQMAEHALPGGELYTDPADNAGMDDNTLMNSMFADYRGGGGMDRITKAYASRYGHALNRGLIKTPELWRPGRAWSAIPTQPGRPPLTVVVRT